MIFQSPITLHNHIYTKFYTVILAKYNIYIQICTTVVVFSIGRFYVPLWCLQELLDCVPF